MQLTINGINHNQPIADTFAFCRIDPTQHVTFAANRNPALAWDGVPEGTRSLVLLCVDVDAPSKPDDVNKEDREVPADLPRTDFYHWVMVDIAPSVTHISEAACADGVITHGKQTPSGPAKTRQGLNDYSGWFADDNNMAGEYYGYDGPCPPWNDSTVHRYYFRLFATDLESCPVTKKFTGQDVVKALAGHVLDQAEIMATYTLNPRLL